MAISRADLAMGDMVAVRGEDQKWYRGYITHIQLPNDNWVLTALKAAGVQDLEEDSTDLNEQNNEPSTCNGLSNNAATENTEIENDAKKSINYCKGISNPPISNGNHILSLSSPKKIDASKKASRDCNGNIDGEKIIVFLVDFGVYTVATEDGLRELRTDFLSLPHQAFKVSLAGVQPV